MSGLPKYSDRIRPRKSRPMNRLRFTALLLACAGWAALGVAAPEEDFVATPQPEIELIPPSEAPPPRETEPVREDAEGEADGAEITSGQPEEPGEVVLELPLPPALPPEAPAAEGDAEPDFFERHIEEFNRADDAPTTAAETIPLSETGGVAYVFQVIFSLVLLCSVIIFGGWALRRFGRHTPLLAGPTLGTVMGRVYLSPRASLHYVRTGGRVLVIGVTQRGIEPVAEFDADTFDAARETPTASPAGAPGAPADFLAQLRGQAGRRAAGAAAAGDDDLANLRGEIQQLQEYLRSRPRDVEE